jgi:hypothetical protein
MVKVGELMEVILYAEDMGAQVAFYRNTLGLAVKAPRDVHGYGELFWVELATGSCTLALHAGSQGRLGMDSPKIVFRVSDVPVVQSQLLAEGVRPSFPIV